GDFASAQAIAERGLERTRAQANSYAAWTLRLLRAESLVLQQKIADARAALDGAMPASPEFESLRARQKYVEARALIAEGRLRDALDRVEAARGLSANRDVRFDLDVVGGQLRLRLGQRAEAESVLQAVVSRAGAEGDHYHQALALNDLGMGRLV